MKRFGMIAVTIGAALLATGLGTATASAGPIPLEQPTETADTQSPAQPVVGALESLSSSAGRTFGCIINPHATPCWMR
ncbi:hypothetical protein IU459_10375 [Nocardia amamiensis]|uniref:Uncharacterized protein n=1 Tax=Nocardia amamiensis TaxID=404578 RepID=A0ABS0CMY8_9NOCA|nr:hypothetical protein [Nocardia amamiensis]MBF6297952.1 hypothetical protein [Nocardia amamiensis]